MAISWLLGSPDSPVEISSRGVLVFFSSVQIVATFLAMILSGNVHGGGETIYWILAFCQWSLVGLALSFLFRGSQRCSLTPRWSRRGMILINSTVCQNLPSNDRVFDTGELSHQPRALELYRRKGSELQKVGESTLGRADALTSSVVLLGFHLARGELRSQIEVTHVETGQRWVV